MPHARNPIDGTRVYFEDDGGNGATVVLYGGILDSVALVRESDIARSLKDLHEEFRLVFADHRGLGSEGPGHPPFGHEGPRCRIGNGGSLPRRRERRRTLGGDGVRWPHASGLV